MLTLKDFLRSFRFEQNRPTRPYAHQHAKHHNGPDIPRRYGSARSEVCACGAWRMVTHHDEANPEWGWNWRTDSIEDAAKPYPEM